MPDIAIRKIVLQDHEAVLRSILSASDYGVLLTDLGHVTIACNRKFGEIFGVDIDKVVHSEVQEVRRMVESLIPDLESWEAALDTIYADPLLVQEDELVLLHTPPRVIRRFTGPVLDTSEQVVGRLWTFLDVTEESHRREIRETLYKVSTLYDEDPKVVYQAVVEEVANHYDSNAVLSILVDDTLEFRVVASQIPEFRAAKGNKYRESYCQYAMEASGPVLIQDASLDDKYCHTLPYRHGFTRYLGVPIKEPGGNVIGTLCFLDGSSDKLIGNDDLQFMSLMAMRVSAELAREAFLAARIAEKEAVVVAQKIDLDKTRQVLAAMNSAFELLGVEDSLQGLVMNQLKVMNGLLGLEDIGLFVGEDQGGRLAGGTISRAKSTPVKAVVEGPLALDSVFHDKPNLVLPLRNLPGHRAYLVITESEGHTHDLHHQAYLDAIVEQVSLLLASFLLQRELNSAYDQLKSTHEQLVQSEKLSVVGTLAASTAHDIKNILSSVTLELDQSETNPERALAAVKDQMDRFSVLGHRLLSYAKPRLVAMHPLAIDEVIHRVLALTSAHTRVTGVTVVLNGGQSVPLVLGDPNQIEHLFVNLVLNAVQAMHANGGKLTLSIRGGCGAVEVEVSDTGKGLSKEAERALFEPFASTRTEGFGLGLYSCKRIIEEHGGEIRVRSGPDSGTTFTVKLKAVEA